MSDETTPLIGAFETETGAAMAAEAIRAGLEPVAHQPGDVFHVVAPSGWTVQRFDEEDLLENPRREKGTLIVHNGDSFLMAINQRGGWENRPVGFYANENREALVAVLNDDMQLPGWRDHRVELRLQATPEWTFWKDGQGQGTQEKFAEHIHNGALEIREPDAATMLTIAETFEAQTESRFSAGAKVSNGQRQITFAEKVNATAGESGSLVIPEQIVLGLRPYVGSDTYRVVCDLRFRIREGKLSIGYHIQRPHEVQRAAFLDEVKKVREATNGEVILGEPPAPRT